LLIIDVKFESIVFGERGLAGEVLKKRREELGIEIKEASEILKISFNYLSAIENDIFDKLPVAVYTIGYIRCYAKYLEVDAEPVILNFISHLPTPKPSTIMPVYSSRREVPGYLYVVLALLTGLLVFVVYTYTLKNRTGSIPVENSKVSGTEKKPAPVASIYTEPLPLRPPEAKVSLMQTVPGQVLADKKEHRLEISAHAITWILIKFEDGKVEGILLNAGLSRSWEFRGSAELKIGNAGGVMLKFDGKDLGVPGKPGQVLNLAFPQV